MSTELRIELLSSATFGRGSGTAGEVDLEVVHDDLGLPEIPGRTIKGLLRHAWLSMARAFPADRRFAEEILGAEGAMTSAGDRLRIGDARVPELMRQWIEYACHRSSPARVSPVDILRAFTDMRRQTAGDRTAGGPAEGSLRATRVVLQQVTFVSDLDAHNLVDDHWRVIARACLAVREAGVGRNRGRGAVSMHLWRDGLDATARHASL